MAKRRRTRRSAAGRPAWHCYVKGITQKRGQMNGHETAYADVLAKLQAAGEIVWWAYEPWKFRVGVGARNQAAWYTPDFAVLYADGRVELVEVKARYWPEASRVRIKAAADRYPMFHWVGVTLERNLGWAREEFS